MRLCVHTDNEDSTEGKTHSIPALSRNLRLAVPVASILMLLLIAVTVYLPGDVTHLFVPVYVFMVIVYVLASIYMFKTLIEKDTSSQ